MADQDKESRNIPYPIKREVRQRCGFGCVICGLPLYEYDHIVEWSETKEHEASNITLLCDKHHKEKTHELLPIEKVIEANKNPYNKQKGHSSPLALHYSKSDIIEIAIGNCNFKFQNPQDGFTLTPFSIYDHPVIQFKLDQEQLFLSLWTCNKEDKLILTIKENELVYATDSWDIEMKKRNLVLREGHGSILLGLLFKVPNKIAVKRGFLSLAGVDIIVHRDYIEVPAYEFCVSGLNFLGNSHIFAINPRSRKVGKAIVVKIGTKFIGGGGSIKTFGRVDEEDGCIFYVSHVSARNNENSFKVFCDLKYSHGLL